MWDVNAPDFPAEGKRPRLLPGAHLQLLVEEGVVAHGTLVGSLLEAPPALTVHPFVYLFIEYPVHN